jgi:uncharacterized membrane protein
MTLSFENRTRIQSIDIVRGFIMVLMALDHTRDFFYDLSVQPLDLNSTYPALFLTRWVTHYCAPIFVFLAGTGAFLSLDRSGSKKATSLFLLTRGIWILFLEIAVINLSWTFDLSYEQMFLQVFWAIGWSMISLSVLIWLPFRLLAVIGLLIVLGHNLLDPVLPAQWGSNGWIWMAIHESGYVAFTDTRGLYFGYPILPWIGVMICGFVFGTIYKRPEAYRRKALLLLGLGSVLLFIVLRSTNWYGNEMPAQPYNTLWKNVLSFIDVQKYPPSLQFLLMTLGPCFIALALLEKTNNKISRIFQVYGKVPMFYYLLHVPLIHLIAIITAFSLGFDLAPFFSNMFFNKPDPAWGFSLGIVYVVWIAVVALLYYPCRWFMKVKATHKKWWLSYL